MKQYEVHLVNLDPTLGHEIKKNTLVSDYFHCYHCPHEYSIL